MAYFSRPPLDFRESTRFGDPHAGRVNDVPESLFNVEAFPIGAVHAGDLCEEPSISTFRMFSYYTLYPRIPPEIGSNSSRSRFVVLNLYVLEAGYRCPSPISERPPNFVHSGPVPGDI
jgi:hypothetical protein